MGRDATGCITLSGDDDDDEDVAEITAIRGYTLTSRASQLGMVRALRYVESLEIEGDLVECGVWRGGNIMLARRLLPDRVCWLYDTFTGMTEPGPEDLRRSGDSALESYHAKRSINAPWCRADLNDVIAGFVHTRTYDVSKMRLVIGDVLETLTVEEHLPEKIALLRLDTDWYASTKLELEVLYPRLSPGGILIIDDYGHWQGAKRAVDEYLGADVRFLEHLDYTAVKLVKPC